MEKQFYVYIMASQPNGTLYIGFTSELAARVWKHKNHVTPGFTAKYNVDTLVYYETHSSAEAAIHREKRLKEWKRQWKIELIEEHNPLWIDLCEQLE